MSMIRFFSVLTSFIFFVAPVASHAMYEVNNQCLICRNSVPEDSKDKIETSCHHEFCRDCLLDWWTNKKKETEEGGWEFMPQCPMCKTYQSLDLYCRHKDPTLISGDSPIRCTSSEHAADEGVSDEDVCPICLVGIGSSELITTACMHRFHKECLNKWVEVSPHENCPVCRERIGAGRDSASDLLVNFERRSAWRNNLYEREPVLLTSSGTRHDEADEEDELDPVTYAWLAACGLYGVPFLVAVLCEGNCADDDLEEFEDISDVGREQTGDSNLVDVKT